MEFLYIVIAFVAGFVVCLSRAKISAWAGRRAEANKVVAARKLIDGAQAAENALANAKLVVFNSLPKFPPNPKPTDPGPIAAIRAAP
jgi:hypothetical protein